MVLQGVTAQQAIHPTAGASGTPSPRLVTAAHEFEAAMMKELMAPLQSSAGSGLSPDSDKDEGDDESGSGSALVSFAAEALGKAISEHGGLGLARSIIGQLSHPAGQSDSTHGSTSGALSGNFRGNAGPRE